MRMCLVILSAIHLAACTASWRAPVETRGGRPAASPPPRPTLASSEYRVQRGDTLYAIAWQSGTDYRLLAAWNGIRPPYHIYPGQTLRLSPPATPRNPPPDRQPVAKSKPRTASPRPAAAPARTAPQPSTPAPSQSRRLAWRWPATGRVVSTFKADEPLRKGIRIAGRSGAPIYAAEAGRVVYAGSGLIGYGRLIIVKHNDKYLSAYGHNREILVREGDQVTKGQKVAEMGTANNGEPLLHFEIRRDGKPIDPLRQLPPR